MTKNIWITIGVLSIVLILAFKQVGKEPELERPTEQGASEENAQEQKDYIVSEGGNIKVESPKQGEKISSPILVKGEARVFENVFSIRLKDKDGKTIIEKSASADAKDTGEFGAFAELLLFEEKLSGSGVLEVFSRSPKDGAEQDMVSIPVEF